MKILNSLDFGTDPLGAPLVAGDLSGMTRQFSVPLSTLFKTTLSKLPNDVKWNGVKTLQGITASTFIFTHSVISS